MPYLPPTAPGVRYDPNLDAEFRGVYPQPGERRRPATPAQLKSGDYLLMPSGRMSSGTERGRLPTRVVEEMRRQRLQSGSTGGGGYLPIGSQRIPMPGPNAPWHFQMPTTNVFEGGGLSPGKSSTGRPTPTVDSLRIRVPSREEREEMNAEFNRQMMSKLTEDALRMSRGQASTRIPIPSRLVETPLGMGVSGSSPSIPPMPLSPSSPPPLPDPIDPGFAEPAGPNLDPGFAEPPMRNFDPVTGQEIRPIPLRPVTWNQFDSPGREAARQMWENEWRRRQKLGR